MTILHDLVKQCENEDETSKEIKALLSEGHVWNELDDSGDTAGCSAFRKGLKVVYETFVTAGVQTELLLAAIGLQDVESGYLESRLEFQEDRIADEARNMVMMDWEKELMKKSAELLTPKQGLRVLNVGFGMGIMDSKLQERKPALHVIAEAHPAVLKRMKADGWYDKPNVRIVEGKWQDRIEELAETEYDSIFYDPFGDTYADSRVFFDQVVTASLSMDGKFSFFNGFGADRRISFDVYQQILELDLAELGLSVEYHRLKVPPIVWNDARPYYVMDFYRLPICTYL
jgi:protein arginine N-methyltransferase 2